MMRDVGVFTDRTAETFVGFCNVIQYYLDLKVQIASDKYPYASITFENDILATDSEVIIDAKNECPTGFCQSPS